MDLLQNPGASLLTQVWFFRWQILTAMAYFLSTRKFSIALLTRRQQRSLGCRLNPNFILVHLGAM